MKSTKVRQGIVDVGCDIVGAFLFSLGIYNFAVAAEFAPVGVSGLSLILNHLWGLSMGLTSILLNIPIIFISYRLLGKTFLLSSIRSMVIFAFMLDYVAPIFPVYTGNPLYAAICTGVLTAFGLTIVYLRGGSTGGTDFLVMAIRKLLPHFRIGQITLVIDGVVILIGGFVFRNLDSVILGLIASVVTTMAIDKIMYGLGSGKLIFIVTEHEKDVAKGIQETIDRGCTFLRGQGAFSLEDKTVILCACNNSQVVTVRKVVHESDKDAFIVITDSNEVFGEGFKPINHSLN